jgi:hypothetical protein
MLLAPQLIYRAKFVTFQKPKWHIKSTIFRGFERTNLLEERVCNNLKNLVISDNKTPQYKNSFFVGTTTHWKHLPEDVVHAKSAEAFKITLAHHRH